MTRNQTRAIALAGDIRGGRIDAERLPETDWDLLLLAAEMNKCSAPPMLIASRVIERARRHVGYFAQPPRVRPNGAFRVCLNSALVVTSRGKSYTDIGNSF